MHATIQKPIEEIMNFIKPGEKVFVVGCNNCAWKCHSGGEDETKGMAERLAKRGVEVVGYSTPGPRGMSLCKLDHTRKVLKRITPCRSSRRIPSWSWDAGRVYTRSLTLPKGP